MRDHTPERLLVIKPPFMAWPVGFAYVLACLEKSKIPFDFLDTSFSRDPHSAIHTMLTSNSYFAVASGGLVGMFPFFKDISRILHKTHPELPFILGGNITKDAPPEILFGHVGIDFGILGEAETSLPELISFITSDTSRIDELQGVSYRDSHNVIRINPPKRLDLTTLNILPSWHHFDVDAYISSASAPFLGDHLKYMPILTGRGCVGKCSFCSPSIGGFRKRPIAHVMEEIAHLIDTYDFASIMFYNEMFYPTAHEIREFCMQYMSLQNRKPWIAQVRVDANLDVGTFVQMKESGCIAVSAGIESGSDKVLKLMNKNTTAKDIRQFFRNATAAGMPANGTYIVGSEGETEADLKLTVDLIIEEEIHTSESLMYVYPGTQTYRNAVRTGLIGDETEYLKQLVTSGTTLFSERVMSGHLNVGDIDDAEFVGIATREARRYNTFVFWRYLVNDLNCVLESDTSAIWMAVKGSCKECGSDVGIRYIVVDRGEYCGVLGLGVNTGYVCPHCFEQLSYNLYACKTLQGAADHFESLREKIRVHERILIGGINGDVMFLLRINLFDIEYGKIVGIACGDAQYADEFYVSVPVVKRDAVIDVNPDFILMVDASGDCERSIRKAFERRRVAMPEMRYLFDEEVGDVLRDAIGGQRKSMAVRSKRMYRGLTRFLESGGIHIPERVDGGARYVWEKCFRGRR